MFDQSTVASVGAPQYSGSQVFITWTPTTSGLLWQVYLNAAKAYEGIKTGIWLPIPTGGVSRVDIGSIPATEAGTDFSSSLPLAPARRAKLTWTGGTSLGADLDHFVIYGESTPGGGINYSTPLATLSAFPGGSTVASGTYSWTSSPLTSGTWNYAIKPVDTAGNEGTAQTTSVTIAAPPGPPAKFTDGTRLHYTFNAGPPVTATLAWNAAEWD